MSRLIDADELKRAFIGNRYGTKAIEYVIDDAPTVEAIPIEWIEKWLDKTTGTRDGENISQLPEQLKFAIGMINLMEMEWEKESGSRKGEEEK